MNGKMYQIKDVYKPSARRLVIRTKHEIISINRVKDLEYHVGHIDNTSHLLRPHVNDEECRALLNGRRTYA